MTKPYVPFYKSLYLGLLYLLIKQTLTGRRGAHPTYIKQVMEKPVPINKKGLAILQILLQDLGITKDSQELLSDLTFGFSALNNIQVVCKDKLIICSESKLFLKQECPRALHPSEENLGVLGLLLAQNYRFNLDLQRGVHTVTSPANYVYYIDGARGCECKEQSKALANGDCVHNFIYKTLLDNKAKLFDFLTT